MANAKKDKLIAPVVFVRAFTLLRCVNAQI